MIDNTVKDIRSHFIRELHDENFTIDKTGVKTIELIGANFIADEMAIFGTPSKEYIKDEISWYEGMSTNINDIYPVCVDTMKPVRDPPKAWDYAANSHGEINSNYGKLIFSEFYYSQYQHAFMELVNNPDSRRAIMIYNRPSIWTEFNDNGKNDFICTNAHTYYIRNNKMDVVVQMRSNDIWAGYRNDWAWAKYVLERMLESYNFLIDAKVELGKIHWQVQNLHCYEKNFWMVDSYSKYGKVLKKIEYDTEGKGPNMTRYHFDKCKKGLVK